MTIPKLISRKSRWTQHADARNKKGFPVNISRFYYEKGPRLKDIQSFSLQGAIVMLYPPETHQRKRDEAVRNLSRSIKQHTGKDTPIAQFNDARSTTYEDIERVLEIYKSL
jgi:hypothetical protein